MAETAHEYDTRKRAEAFAFVVLACGAFLYAVDQVEFAFVVGFIGGLLFANSRLPDGE